jgi:hypothetical protein
MIRPYIWWLTISKRIRVWGEVDYEQTDLETVIQDLLSGQYNSPSRVVAFNTAEKWSHDVSEDVAQEPSAPVRSVGARHPVFPTGLH